MEIKHHPVKCLTKEVSMHRTSAVSQIIRRLQQMHFDRWFIGGVKNLFAIAGHFVSYRWVSGRHKFLVILWNLLKAKKIVHQQKQATNERI